MVCHEVQLMVRAKMLSSIVIDNKNGCFWMTAPWSTWYQMVRREPTTADRLTFIENAVMHRR